MENNSLVSHGVAVLIERDGKFHFPKDARERAVG